MCKCLSLSHITKIHIILIKQTIFSKKMKKKGDQVSDLLCPKLTELLYKLFATRLFVVLTFVPVAVPLNELPTTKLSDILAPLKP